jgi:cobalt-zinc-cadmium efflux system outer membrane protein
MTSNPGFSMTPTHPWGALLLVVAGSVLGCAGPRPDSNLPARPALIQDRIPSASAPEPSIASPRGLLTLSAALDAALEHNPALSAPSMAVEATEAETRQAGRPPNPELDAEVENVLGSGALSGTDAAETTVSLAQRLELGGKRTARVAEAASRADRAAWRYEEARLDVLTATEAAFVELLSAQEELALAEELVRLATDVLRSAERRVAAGSSSTVETRQAEVELARADIDLGRAHREVTRARGQMAATWGGREALFDRAVGSLERGAELPPLAELLDRAPRAPELLALRLARVAQAAIAEGERASRWPDLTVSAGIRHLRDAGDVGVRVGIGLPLPLFDRNADGVHAAEAWEAVATAEHAARAVALEVEIASRHAALEATRLEIAALGDRAVPAARHAFADAEDAYRRGRLRLADVLDVERTLFDLERQRIGALTRFHLELIELERLLGEPLHPSHDDDQERP